MVQVVLRIYICSLAVCGGGTIVVLSGPQFLATKGEVWPKPQEQLNYGQYYYVDLDNFQFIVTEKTCSLLDEAITRYWRLMVAQHTRDVPRAGPRGAHPASRRRCSQLAGSAAPLTELRVRLVDACEYTPHIDMDESYELSIGMNHTADGEPEAELTSRSVWGALRGLETFSQLHYQLYDCDNTVIINVTAIRDYPRFPHRGLMVDTSRHFIAVAKLLQILDAMAYNKLNVFHWHIVDDQSFPYKSKQFPTLSERGAYHRADLVYTEKDVKLVIEYARERAIRVVPEFDIPGHTRSWGEAYPSLLTKCFFDDTVRLGPMDPTSDFTYKFLNEFFDEIKEVFPDKYLHYGGNEVDFTCWAGNPFIKRYMKQNKISTTSQLLTEFMGRVLAWAHQKRPIIWQDAVDIRAPTPNDAVVQIWRETTREDITAMMSVGYHVLFSHCWYLNQSSVSWKTMYNCEPSGLLKRLDLEELVLGGEACMWTDNVDGHNVIPRIFPRASAVAERLWSARDVTNTDEASLRLEEHACRMNARGIDTQPPNGPGFCLHADSAQTYSLLEDLTSESDEHIVILNEKSVKRSSQNDVTWPYTLSDRHKA